MSTSELSPAPRNAATFVSVVALLREGDAAARQQVPALWRIMHDRYENFEIVLVADGLSPQSLQTWQELLQTHDCIRILRLSRAFGREPALLAGLEAAIGDVVVALDLGTDPVEAIPELVVRCGSGGGAIVGVDPARTGESVLQRAATQVFYALAERLGGIQMIRNATGLLVLSRGALGALLRIREQAHHPQVFLPYIGFEVQTWPYTPAGRTKTKLGLFGAMDRGVAIVVTGSVRPLRAVAWLSVAAAGLNLLYMVYVVATALFKPHVAEGWTTMSLQNGGMFFLMFLVLAVLSEYVARVLAESRRRPTYVVRDEYNSSVVVAAQDRRNIVNESA